ncbi:MAG: ABC transporter permease subunit [Lachnospiraceae bacterium]|nr:ABC transporter permease subunit [Lachnospiraceae bacterium]
MWELIKYELQKLLGKKLVWACLAGMAIMLIAMTSQWLYPGTETVQYFQDGKLVILENQEAIRTAKAIGRKYEGPLTDEKVQAVLAEFDMKDEDLIGAGLDPSNERYYSHNFLYSSLRNFYASDGTWNGMTVQEVYGDLAPGLNVGYTGWEKFLYVSIYTLLSLGCVITIILAPLFSEEYTKRTDALILTGAYGKTKCARAKIIAGSLISLGLTALVLLIFGVVYLFHYGTDGWNTSLQLSHFDAFTGVSYPMTFGQGVLYALLMWFTAGLTLTAAAVLISAIAKSTFTSLVISFVVFVVPMFLPWRNWDILNLPAQFFPIRQMQLADIFNHPLLQLGGFELNIMWLALPVALVVTLICILYARRAFARHQVMG